MTPFRNTVGFAVLLTFFTLSSLARADEDAGAFQQFKVLKPAVALELAEAAMKDCRQRGYQVAVAVVDRFGLAQVMLRDRFAGAHTPETASRKAWTAASFRTNTGEVAKLLEEDRQYAGLAHIPKALILGGGVVIDAGGVLVGAVGVSGAPSPQADEDCAKAGIAAVEDKIAF